MFCCSKEMIVFLSGNYWRHIIKVFFNSYFFYIMSSATRSISESWKSVLKIRTTLSTVQIVPFCKKGYTLLPPPPPFSDYFLPEYTGVPIFCAGITATGMRSISSRLTLGLFRTILQYSTPGPLHGKINPFEQFFPLFTFKSVLPN